MVPRQERGLLHPQIVDPPIVVGLWDLRDVDPRIEHDLPLRREEGDDKAGVGV